MSELPPTRMQRWLFRQRRPVRAGCVIFILVLIGWAIYSFIDGKIVQGVLAVLICLSPLGLFVGTRSVEQLVARHDLGTD